MGEVLQLNYLPPIPSSPNTPASSHKKDLYTLSVIYARTHYKLSMLPIHVQ